MSNISKKFTALILLFFFLVSPVFAKENVKFLSQINHEFKLAEMSDYIELKTSEDVTLQGDIVIPKNSILKAKVLEARAERRWHRSGFIVCKLLEYTIDITNANFDISDKDIYFLVRKYDVINKKDAAIITAEIVLTQAASIVGSCFIVFAPVDIAYFFTKGAIQRKNNPNWFKSGVSCAYENSIFWFWLKGKTIDLDENQGVKLKKVEEERALKLTNQIKNKKEKQAVKIAKKEIKKQIKQDKKEIKAQLKEEAKEKRNVNKIITQSDLEKLSDSGFNIETEDDTESGFQACASIEVE